MTEREFRDWLNAAANLWRAIETAHAEYMLTGATVEATNAYQAALDRMNTHLAPYWSAKARPHRPTAQRQRRA